MKWAVIIYAVFMIDGEPQEKISWGLTFPHHEKCIEFFASNQGRIISGLDDFAKSNIEGDYFLTQVGCAHATADFEGPTEAAEVTLRMPLWQGSNT